MHFLLTAKDWQSKGSYVNFLPKKGKKCIYCVCMDTPARNTFIEYELYLVLHNWETVISEYCTKTSKSLRFLISNFQLDLEFSVFKVTQILKLDYKPCLLTPFKIISTTKVNYASHRYQKSQKISSSSKEGKVEITIARRTISQVPCYAQKYWYFYILNHIKIK